ncbi:phosphotransferase family protein [Streptomyces stramineus]
MRTRLGPVERCHPVPQVRSHPAVTCPTVGRGFRQRPCPPREGIKGASYRLARPAPPRAGGRRGPYRAGRRRAPHTPRPDLRHRGEPDDRPGHGVRQGRAPRPRRGPRGTALGSGHQPLRPGRGPRPAVARRGRRLGTARLRAHRRAARGPLTRLHRPAAGRRRPPGRPGPALPAHGHRAALRGPLGPLPRRGTRELLRGEALLHTDTNPHNLMVTDRRAYLVDWATPALGPAWVDVAYTAVRLMEADCPRAEVLAWAARFPSWASARPEALAAFVAAHCRRWEATVGAAAARPSNARFAALLSLL